MERHDDRSAGPTDQQIFSLLQQNRRITFLAPADLLPAYSWRSLFVALSRGSHQQHVELIPLSADYEVLWRHSREGSAVKPEESCVAD